jgi:zinc finger HIT domain-containing protein 1
MGLWFDCNKLVEFVRVREESSEMNVKVTRNSKRTKKLSAAFKSVDEETRKYVLQTRIDEMESDFYESPHRMAEEKSEDEYDFEEEAVVKETSVPVPKRGNRKPIEKLAKQKQPKKKKNKKEHFLKRNLNLKKMLKEENLLDIPGSVCINLGSGSLQNFPNFVNTKSSPSPLPARKYCSICGLFSCYKCPRCGERYCGAKCYETHADIMCLKFDNFA